MSLSDKFRSLRAETGLSQVRFAAYFGIPEKTYTKWELGVREPPEYVYNLIARWLAYFPLTADSRPDDKPICIDILWDPDPSEPFIKGPIQAAVVMCPPQPPIVADNFNLTRLARIIDENS